MALPRVRNRILRGPFTAQPVGQIDAPPLTAAMVGEHPASHAVQPEMHLGHRCVVESPPGHQERLGDNVRRLIGTGAPEYVPQHTSVILGIQPLEPFTTRASTAALISVVVHA